MNNLAIRMCYFYHLIYDKNTKVIKYNLDISVWAYASFLEDDVFDLIVGEDDNKISLGPDLKEPIEDRIKKLLTYIMEQK